MVLFATLSINEIQHNDPRHTSIGCRYAECRVYLIVMLGVAMLNVIILCVVMLIAIMQSVGAPYSLQSQLTFNKF